ncbi:peptidoglycan-binding protein [Streptomyces sp. NPDC057236]|uniref:peptidoglycan-binding domain-containing protein n=1 Tax=Streptomyces sp. NPDC057236 TaxID=3346059 RepID=UPI003627003E
MPRNSDNTPSCACTIRASDALRDARTAEAAAAEDFDPLRIRPYVELDGGAGRSTPDGSAEAAGAAGAPAPSAEEPGAPGAADETMTLRAVPPEAAPGATNPTSVLPTPLAPGAARPNATDLHLFDTTRPLAAVPAAPGPAHTDEEPPRRRRRGMLFAVAGAVVAVVGAAGWASGVFSYETPSRDGAAPEEVRASVPDPSSSAPPSAEPSAGASSAAPSSSASPSASPSASASTSASPSPSASTTSASPSESAAPSSTPTVTASTDSAEDTEEEGGGGTGPVLRRGDRGAEVTELQLRLKEMWLYNDEINGQFNRRVEESLRNYQWSRGLQSELSVYGPETRARLEAETQEP